MRETETFGQRLRRLRQEAGLLQRDIAGESLDPSYISLLEKDRRQPTEETVNLLASSLGCTAQYLLEGMQDPEDVVILARAEVGLGNPEAAMRLLEPVVQPLQNRMINRQFDFEAIETYASALERTGKPDKAILQLERLREAAESDPRTFPLLQVSLSLVRCYKDIGEFTRAIQVGERAMEMHRTLGLRDIGNHGALVSTVAISYALAGDLVYATHLLEQLANDAEATGDIRTQAYACWNAAVTSAQRGELAEARHLIERASGLLDATDDLRNRARVRSAQASILLQQSPADPEAARKILRSELPALRQHGGAASLSRAEVELARCELMLGRPDVARRLAASSLKRLSSSHRIERADAGAVHGAALIALGERDAGVVEYEQSVQTLVDAGAKRQAATVLQELASIHAERGDSVAAYDCSHRALQLLGVRSRVTVEGERREARSQRRVKT